MRKRKRGRKFSRKRDQRRALLKNLGSALVLREKIKTSEAKAKELRSFIDRSVTHAKKNDALYARRILARRFPPRVAKKLMSEIGPRYKTRKGGYTRITKLVPRTRDSARMAVIEFVK